MDEFDSALAVRRVRHALKLRRARVQAVRRISPHIVGVTLAGDELRDFVSASFDDHVKLMLPPRAGEPLVLPTAGPDGPVWADGAPRPAMRDYTPRGFDSAAGTLELEFALHGDGPAAAWAARAAPGDEVGVGGPRGSLVVPLGFDWHLLVGDDTALPAIARRLEELPAAARAIVIVELDDAADRRQLVTQSELKLQWLDRGAASSLAEAVRAMAFPPGTGFAWAAGEARSVAAVRRVLVEERGIPKQRVRASAYWKQGATAHHENLEG